MRVGLIYYTKDYHKLVEYTARQCYQSWGKLGEDSHKFVKGILKAGHVSIASTGNIVFGVAGITGLEEYTELLSDLVTMKEINNYIRWTFPDPKKNPDSNIGIIVSMNMLTFMDIYNHIDEYAHSKKLFDAMLKLVKNVPELAWFVEDNVDLEPRSNVYYEKRVPSLYDPIILTEDYTSLKSKGLTDYELDIHATVTVNMMVDRAAGLQLWRHADMTGGTELSQRYVDRSNAGYRLPVDFKVGLYPDGLEEKFKNSSDSAKEDYDNLVEKVNQCILESVNDYSTIKTQLAELGVRHGRAKEIARSILPNAMTTQIINCRPLRQWKHLFELRDSSHAQKEIQEDVRAIKKAFKEAKIKL